MLTPPTQEELSKLKSAAEAAADDPVFLTLYREMAELASPETILYLYSLIDTQQKEITRLQGLANS